MTDAFKLSLRRAHIGFLDAGVVGGVPGHLGHADLLRERIDGRIGQ